MRARAGARNRYGVAVNLRVIAVSSLVLRPWGVVALSRSGAAGEGRSRVSPGLGGGYLMSAFALATASSRAFWGSTLLNSADSIAWRTISLTSAFLGIDGTM